MTPSPFASFFMAGFECSSQRRRDGVPLDLIAGTGHDRFALQDYALVRRFGLCTVRDGLRWRTIERQPGIYDWSSWRPMLRAAAQTGVQVIWDLCHYGWPDGLDIWSQAFVDRFAAFAEAAARVHREETGAVALFCPINEISFFAWAAGEVGYFSPGDIDRGRELKRQLIRAAVAGARAVRAVDPRTRLVWAEPLINVPAPDDPALVQGAREMHLGQYEAFDAIAGLADADLGGAPDLLDQVGVNFYPHNQWAYLGVEAVRPAIPLGHHAYRDLGELLLEVHVRYGRPMLIAETGAERGGRAAWLHYVCDEVRAAVDQGVRIDGICLYPILAYPGWDNDRHCEAGLFGAADADGRRKAHEPLARELARQQEAFGLREPARTPLRRAAVA